MDVARVKAIPLFSDFSENELKTVATFAAETSVEAGRTLVDQGEYSWQFFAIEDGSAEVIKDGEKVSELGPGDFFGEIGLLERTARTASVRSTTPMRLITLTQWDMKRALRAMPELRDRIDAAIGARRES